ncbi:uncharacterized protein LOC129597069 [Paramacrobiotus metropolitanus]|uniref:uncharacterized protein LOC129597069 n=1 Tax=Paramacrobiotus metropolitanus TaxID=2943436 RepID=UPI002446231E|nr:uncharacterized protein LOC129597069 [Paramacrobiotus metropolitanus]
METSVESGNVQTRDDESETNNKEAAESSGVKGPEVLISDTKVLENTAATNDPDPNPRLKTSISHSLQQAERQRPYQPKDPESHSEEVTIAKVLSTIDWENIDVQMTTSDEETMSSSSDSDVYVPAAVCKLRALARVVMINLRWAKDIRRMEEFKGFETTHHDEETGHRRSSFFKVADFIASNRIISGLTDQEKEALRLHPFGRKTEDIQLILKIMERYQCFDKFTQEVRENLAMWVRYDTFDDGRILLRQGHEPYSMYFILSGNVNFKASDTDPRTGRTNFYSLGSRGPGSIIGEIELLNKDERRSTGSTQGDVELLRVDEDPFDEILRTSFEAIWEDRFAGLRSAQTFESWSDSELRILNENSSLIAFPENKAILTDVCGQSAFTYFIQKGRCALVKDVIFEKSYLDNDKRHCIYQALEPDDPRRWLPHQSLSRHSELEGHHLHITELKEGDYFGVGEDLRRAHIITVSAVECLTIPHSVFEKAMRLQFLEELKADLEDAIPTDDVIASEWLALQTWKQFQRKDMKKFWTSKNAVDDYVKFYTPYKHWR